MNKDNTKEVITWAAENGDGQSLQGLIDGLAEFMITIDFKKGESHFFARYGLESIGYYETLKEAKQACEDHWEEMTRPIPTEGDRDWSIDGDGYLINP